MEDRELLELAAKAAGIEIYESTDGTVQNRHVWVFTAGGRMGTMPYEERWNPLIDDAQALRLAVKLGMTVLADTAIDGTVAAQIDPPVSPLTSVWADELAEPDPYSATRRAIVRAAAEIGRAM